MTWPATPMTPGESARALGLSVLEFKALNASQVLRERAWNRHETRRARRGAFVVAGVCRCGGLDCRQARCSGEALPDPLAAPLSWGLRPLALRPWPAQGRESEATTDREPIQHNPPQQL